MHHEEQRNRLLRLFQFIGSRESEEDMGSDDDLSCAKAWIEPEKVLSMEETETHPEHEMSDADASSSDEETAPLPNASMQKRSIVSRSSRNPYAQDSDDETEHGKAKADTAPSMDTTDSKSSNFTMSVMRLVHDNAAPRAMSR